MIKCCDCITHFVAIFHLSLSIYPIIPCRTSQSPYSFSLHHEAPPRSTPKYNIVSRFSTLRFSIDEHFKTKLYSFWQKKNKEETKQKWKTKFTFYCVPLFICIHFKAINGMRRDYAHQKIERKSLQKFTE